MERAETAGTQFGTEWEWLSLIRVTHAWYLCGSGPGVRACKCHSGIAAYQVIFHRWTRVANALTITLALPSQKRSGMIWKAVSYFFKNRRFWHWVGVNGKPEHKQDSQDDAFPCFQMNSGQRLMVLEGKVPVLNGRRWEMVWLESGPLSRTKTLPLLLVRWERVYTMATSDGDVTMTLLTCEENVINLRGSCDKKVWQYERLKYELTLPDSSLGELNIHGHILSPF